MEIDIRTQRPLIVFIALLTGMLSVASADEIEDAEKEELAKQQAFRTGFEAIVDDLNDGSLEKLARAVDQQDLFERILGLRLISQKVKRNFIESYALSTDRSAPAFKDSRFYYLISTGFTAPEDGVTATLLGLESRADFGRAVVRFNLNNLQFSYHVYDLRLDKQGHVVVVDWTDYADGLRFSESIARPLIMVAPSNAAMRKLLDFQNARERDLFQFGELLKAARDRRLDRYLELRDLLDPRFQRQRIVVETSVHLAKLVRKRRQMVAGLQIMAEHFPEEPLYSLMLLDYYFPSKKYEEAFQALQRLSDALDVDDAAMEARLSAAALVMENTADALAYAEAAVAREPGLELGWWSVLSARAATSDYAGAVLALQQLQQQFGHDLSPEALGRNRAYAQLLASVEYTAWRESLK